MIGGEDVAAAKLALGAQLAALRRAKDINQHQLARLVVTSRSSIANVESGRQVSTRDFWARCDDVLDAHGALLHSYGQLCALQAEQHREAAAGQAAAQALTVSTAGSVLPARAVMTPFGLPQIDLETLRHLTMVMHDARRYLDSSVVEYLRDQLAACAGQDGAEGPQSPLPIVLGLIGTVDWGARQVKPDVRRELLRIGAQCAEFAGWLYRDCAAAAPADYWRDRAMEWAQAAGDRVMEGYVLLKKSQAAWDRRDAIRMLTLAEALTSSDWRLTNNIRAEALQQAARAHAMLGDSIDLVQHLIDDAVRLLADHADTQDTNAAFRYPPALLAVQKAMCYHEAGQAEQAVSIYRETLTPAAFSRRDYGYFMSLYASALASSKNPDEAAETGTAAYDIATATNSARTVVEIVRVARQLDPWRSRSAVRRFHERVLCV
jgi:hypothetical protein